MVFISSIPKSAVVVVVVVVMVAEVVSTVYCWLSAGVLLANSTATRREAFQTELKWQVSAQTRKLMAVFDDLRKGDRLQASLQLHFRQ